MRSVPSRLVLLASAAYAALFFALGADRYATFHSGADLGLFVQTIAGAFSGFSNTFEGTNHFAYHFSPILFLCAPLLQLAHSALALVAIQAVATAATAPALYLIARRRTSERNAAGLACIALLYPPLQGVTFTDFHETAFAPAAVAWLLWAIDARRFWIAGVLLIATLAVKEDQAVAMAFVGAVGVVYFARRREPAGVTFCVLAAVVSVATFVGYFSLVRPMAGNAGAWMPEHFYAWKGYGGAAPLGTQVVARVSYLLEAFVPLAFLPFRSRALLLSLPGFVEVLASREPLTYTMGQHYAAVWVPYVLVAFAIAGAGLLQRGDRRSRTWVRATPVLCVVMLAAFDPLHLGHFLRWPNADDRATDALISRIPQSASIGTYDEIYAHLGFYPRAVIGIRGLPQFVLENTKYRSARWDAILAPQLRRAIGRGEYAEVARIGDVVLYQRTTGGSPHASSAGSAV
ncbi:MAG TPA: DUF2079 domain-containing protein [Candidatus Acidoferrales bacterium]|nr:DUF2079 domain-containing protein [Candidatus Acidoferrales bacterium]